MPDDIPLNNDGVLPGEQQPTEEDLHGMEDATAPSHAEHQYVEFGHIEEGKGLSESEEHVRDGEGFRTKRVSGRIITASGEAITPEQIKGFCIVCGLPENVIHRCMRCGRILCPQHVLKIPVPQGNTQDLCPVHFAEYVEQFDTWTKFRTREQ